MSISSTTPICGFGTRIGSIDQAGVDPELEANEIVANANGYDTPRDALQDAVDYVRANPGHTVAISTTTPECAADGNAPGALITEVRVSDGDDTPSATAPADAKPFSLEKLDGVFGMHDVKFSNAAVDCLVGAVGDDIVAVRNVDGKSVLEQLSPMRHR